MTLSVVTRGFGVGSVNRVVTRGFGAGAAVVVTAGGDYHTYSRIPLRGRKRKRELELDRLTDLEALAEQLRLMPPADPQIAAVQAQKLETQAKELSFDLFHLETVADRAKRADLSARAKQDRERVMRIAAFAAKERARIIDEEEAIFILLS